MDMFENLLDKAKDAFDVAVKATEEVVDTGKQKFNVVSLEAKISKDYKALGELCYKKHKGEDIDFEKINELVADIDAKINEINEIKQAIKNAKAKRICAACGAAIEEDTIFCSYCGAKLEFTTEE